MTTPTTTTIGPMIDQGVVLLIGLPPTTPNPCSAHRRPNNATTTPSPTIAIRMTTTLIPFRVKLLSTRTLPSAPLLSALDRLRGSWQPAVTHGESDLVHGITA